MLSLDEQFEVATRELHDALRGRPLAPVSVVVRRHRRRRRTLVASCVVAAACGVIALGIVVTRPVEPIEPASPTTDVIAQRLLFPTGVPDADIHNVYFGPDLSSSAKGLIRSPDGSIFHVAIGESGGAQLTADADSRQFNGRTFTVERIRSELAYTSIDDCVVVAVEQFDSVATGWDTDASTVLTALRVDGRTGTVLLPSGWESFGVSTGGHLIQLAYTATIDTSRHDVVLMQVPDSVAATLSNLVQPTGPLTSTTFNGKQAWSVGSADQLPTSLIWQDGTNAVLLSGDVNLDELKRIAIDLQHDHADEWTRRLPTAEILSGSDGTTPNPAPSIAGVCGPPKLDIRQGNQAPITNP